MKTLIRKLARERSLSIEEYEALLSDPDPEYARLLARQARSVVYGDEIYIRGLIEIGSFCKNDCLYCGIRRSNRDCCRYRLTKEEILSATEEGYALGFRTFVLQSGEDEGFSHDFLCDLIREIKGRHGDCAVTLSLGERSHESYARLFEAGADRYLLRHETADPVHYGKLHPASQSYWNRMDCLKSLKEIGYQVGCGFMVGSPYQTKRTLAQDLKFVEEFQPEMCGIGPFIPHRNTPFRAYPPGDVELTCYLLSLLRLIRPNLLLPATTALGTLDPMGREKGILAGANVVMPNLTPLGVRGKYELYDNKLTTGMESAQSIEELKERMRAIGYRVVVDRGDMKG